VSDSHGLNKLHLRSNLTQIDANAKKDTVTNNRNDQNADEFPKYSQMVTNKGCPWKVHNP